MSKAGSGEDLDANVDRLQREVAELRASRKRLAEAAAGDRRALERALHDGVQQHLVALALELQRLARLLDDDPSSARTLLDELAANVQEAMDEATELAQRIYPPLLEVQGLAIALRSVAERAGITLLVDVPRSAGYAPEVAAAVYWSCVEALSSASPGSQASVVVSDANGRVAFEIAVAGSHSAVRVDRARDQIEALDGRITVEQAKDGGSVVHGWLPLSG